MFQMKKAQMRMRPEAVRNDEARRIGGLLRQNDPALPVKQAEETALSALRLAQETGLHHRDSVVGLAFLIYAYGVEVFRDDAAAAMIVDPNRTEAERKTMIHAELVRLEGAA